MTNKEAQTIIGNLPIYGDDCYSITEYQEAKAMAIKALETLEKFERAQIIMGGRLNGRAYAYKCGLEDGKRKALDKEPCKDAISRDAVIKAVDAHTNEDGTLDDDISIILEDLPLVTPIRPKGEWKYDKSIQNWRCSKCHETPKTLGYVGAKEFMTEHFKFCNHCGADMRGEKE